MKKIKLAFLNCIIASIKLDKEQMEYKNNYVYGADDVMRLLQRIADELSEK